MIRNDKHTQEEKNSGNELKKRGKEDYDLSIG